jgi:hypothetical protein
VYSAESVFTWYSQGADFGAFPRPAAVQTSAAWPLASIPTAPYISVSRKLTGGHAPRSPHAVLVAMAETWATRPDGLSGNTFVSPGLVWRAHVGELREQVFVGPDLILRHLSI